VAETIVNKLEEHLHRTRKRDLTAEEREQLRVTYADWIRNQT